MTISITAENVAWYGAILATVSFLGTIILGVLEYVRDRSKVKVEAKRGFQYLTVAGLSDEHLIILTAINKGRRPVTLEGFCFRTKSGQSIIFPMHPNITFPYEIEEGKSYKFSVGENELTKDDRVKEDPIIQVMFWDCTGKYYKSNFSLGNGK